MKRLFIADVHANLPALQAVLADAGRVDAVVFLGDAVGFGPYPAQCVELLQSLRPIAVIGNHDSAVLSAGAFPPGSPSPAAIWNAWTLHQLGANHVQWLQALPAEAEIPNVATAEQSAPDCLRGPIKLLHHPPGAPYLHPRMPDDELAGYFTKVAGGMIVCGHSHYGFDRAVNGRRFVCVPSAGQPRDGDPRAGYALEIDGRMELRRVAYDVESAASGVAGLPLPAAFIARWLNFLRTGHDREWSRDASYPPSQRMLNRPPAGTYS